MISRRFASIFVIAVLVLWSFFGAQACGPMVEPDVFVQLNFPDDLEAFGRGHLGILQNGFDSNEYAVAYRYLNGGKLSDAERADDTPSHAGEVLTQEESRARQKAWNNAQPPGAWLLERSHYVSDIAPSEQEKYFPKDFEGNIVFDPNYLNCPDPAIQNATLTLSKRAESWGKGSTLLADWIHGQDAVFANCSGKSVTMPAPAPANSPALLRADRAYQFASANLYAKQYDQATQQFAAIARDKSSPWSLWGEYLAARATVRKAFAMGKATDPYSGDVASFDLDTMRKAQQMLEALLIQHNTTPSRKIVLAELNFIRLRTEPEKRLDEICAALAGPGADDNFAQDRKDLSFVLLKHLPIPNPPPLYEWIKAFRGEVESRDAFALWQKGHALPWLVMSIIRANPEGAFVPILLAEAEKIKPDSAAYDTVFYHRVRLLIGRNQYDEARSLLDRALPTVHGQKPNSNENALLSERMTLARNFKEFLAYAPRQVITTEALSDSFLQASCGNPSVGNQKPYYCPKPGDPPRLDQSLEFDEDSVFVLNRSTPISLLVEAASSPSLPPNLRRDLALATWTRSVVLEDQASAAKLVPLLPNAIRDTAGTSVGFPATLAILRNPGLRPFIEPGISRIASFNVLDDYRDNWWGDSWEDQRTIETLTPHQLQRPAALTKQQYEDGHAEYQRLVQLPHAAALLGRRIVDYAKDHPGDPDVPEALALTVRATHYAQSWSDDAKGNSENTEVSKAAFQMLHNRYPKSPWAIKTRYYY